MLQKRQPVTVGGGQSAEGERAGGPRLHSWIAQVLGWLGEEDLRLATKLPLAQPLLATGAARGQKCHRSVSSRLRSVSLPPAGAQY